MSRKTSLLLMAAALTLLVAALALRSARPHSPVATGTEAEDDELRQPAWPPTPPTLRAEGAPGDVLGWASQRTPESPGWVRLVDGGVAGLLRLRARVTHHGVGVQATVHLGDEAFPSSADGTFQHEEWSSESRLVWAEQGLLRSETFPVWPGRGGEMLLELRGLQPVEGTVVDPSGAPVAGARVSLDSVEEMVRTSDAGAFRFPSVNEGGRRLQVEHPDYSTADRQLKVTAGAAPLLIVLHPAPVIEGVVLEPDGGPAANARLKIEFQSSEEESGTDEEGRFGIVAMALPVMVWAKGSGGSGMASFSEPTRSARVQLKSGCTLQVEVTVDGAPAPGAELTLGGDDPNLANRAEETTDAEGGAILGPIFCRPSTLRGRLKGSPREIRRQVALEKGEDHVALELESGRTLIVQAFDPWLGAVVPGLQVRVAAGEAKVDAKTDAAGRVRFLQLPEGELQVSARFERGPRVTARVTTEREVELRVPTPRRVTGRAVGDDGVPLASLWADGQLLYTEAGAFEVDVDPRDDELKLSSDQHQTEMVKLKPGTEPLDVGTVVLGLRPQVTVSVVLPDGRPAPGASLFWVGAEPFLILSKRAEPDGYTDARGEYLYAASRSFCIRAWLPGFAPSGREGCPFHSQRGLASRLELRLLAPAFVAGRLDVPGEVLLAEEPEDLAAKVGPEGDFRLGPLSAGRHTVMALSTRGWMIKRTVELAEGETRDLLPPDRIRVHVRVRSPTHVPLAGAFPGAESNQAREPVEALSLQPGDGESSGTFETLTPGTWTIRASRPSDSTRHQQVITLEGTTEREVVFDLR